MKRELEAVAKKLEEAAAKAKWDDGQLYVRIYLPRTQLEALRKLVAQVKQR